MLVANTKMQHHIDEQQLLLADNFRLAGNQAFKEKKYQDALKWYRDALLIRPNDALLLCNTAAAYIQLGMWQEAVEDARGCLQLQPGNTKAWYRLSQAYHELGMYSHAKSAAEKGIKCEPGNDALRVLLDQAVAEMENQQRLIDCHIGMYAADAAWTYKQTRQAQQHQEVVQQYQQSMSAPGWEPEDWQWRPVYSYNMRLPPGLMEEMLRICCATCTSTSTCIGFECSECSCNSAAVAAAVALSGGTAAAGPSGTDTCSTCCADGVHAAHDIAALASYDIFEGFGDIPCNSTASDAGAELAATASSMSSTEQKLHLQNGQPEDGTTAASQPQSTAQQTHAQDMQPADGPPSTAERMFLSHYLNGLADLAAPRDALSMLSDETWMAGMKSAVIQALHQKPGAHVLVVGHGTAAIIGLWAAQSGAGSVSCVESCHSTFCMSHSVLQANKHVAGWAKVTLAPMPLTQCTVASEGTATGQSATACKHTPDCSQNSEATSAESCSTWSMPQRADILILADCMDPAGCISRGIITNLRYAAASLMHSQSLVIPHALNMYGYMADCHLPESVSGWTLTALDKYRWHPAVVPLEHGRIPPEAKLLSGAVRLYRLDLQAMLHQLCKDCQIIQPTDTSTNGKHPASTGLCQQLLDMKHVEIAVSNPGMWNSIVLWTEACMSTEGPGSVDTEQLFASCPSLLYHEDRMVQSGSKAVIDIALEQQAIHIIPSLPQSCLAAPQPYYTSSLPKWHFDMVMDEARNMAYDKAIRAAVARKRRELGPEVPITVLDLGCGSGLLSMMAVRAGADVVYAIESSGHIADTAAAILFQNGCASKVHLIHKDGRYVEAGVKRDDTPGEMMGKADILVFEVFDSGLIGEGALHLLAAAQAKLLKPDATVIPGEAKVYCQPIQLNRLHQVGGIDLAPLNQYNWRPEYEGMDLHLSWEGNMQVPSSISNSHGISSNEHSSLSCLCDSLEKSRVQAAVAAATASDSIPDLCDQVPSTTPAVDECNRQEEATDTDAITAAYGSAGHDAEFEFVSSDNKASPKLGVIVDSTRQSGISGNFEHQASSGTSCSHYAASLKSCDCNASTIQATGNKERDVDSLRPMQCTHMPTSHLKDGTSSSASMPQPWAEPKSDDSSVQLTGASSTTQHAPSTHLPKWRPLSQPACIFDFNLTDVIQHHAEPCEQSVTFECQQQGIANAVALWFELKLDEDTALTSSPYRMNKQGRTWQQAVFFIPEQTVSPGDRLVATAKHDTYSIMVKVDQEASSCGPSGVPLNDAKWMAKFQQLQQTSSDVAKATIQNPLEYRKVLSAASSMS